MFHYEFLRFTNMGSIPFSFISGEKVEIGLMVQAVYNDRNNGTTCFQF